MFKLALVALATTTFLSAGIAGAALGQIAALGFNTWFARLAIELAAFSL